MKPSIAIIGDRFMRAQVYEEAINHSCNGRVTCRCMELPWPDEPIEREFEGIKEYQGDPDEVVNFVGSARVLVTHLAPMPERVFASLPGLERIVVTRGGPVNIDMRAAASHGVAVANTPGRNASAVAEFTVGAILVETRRIARGHDGLRAGRFRSDLYRYDLAGRELSDLTIGLIGYGIIGRQVARLLQPFGTRIIVSDPHQQPSIEDRAMGVAFVDFEDLLKAADVVSLHARVTSETEGFIGENEFRMMKPNAVFINTARGPLVDHDAMLRALSEGWIGSAMLDTFSIEPTPPDYPLLQLPNVSATPHIAGASTRTIRNAAQMAAVEIHRWLEGQPPLNPC